jgi:NAD(P)-dependent dehydrogenase (short-subunit alcohol dehydrogenase family)
MTSTRLNGKTAIVTGAGSVGDMPGVGATIAGRFAAEGATVGLLDLSEERAENTRRTIVAAGGKAEILIADIRQTDQCRSAVEDFAARCGGLDILVNNAAVVGGPSLETEDAEAWRALFDVNLIGGMNMSQVAVPHLTRRGAGAIINIASIAGLRGFYGPAYSASKGGIISLTRTLAYLYGRKGIRVNCIAPGHLVSPQGAPDEATQDLLRRSNMLGTHGSAMDVAFAAVFLASDEARWITGIVLPVDGGITATTASGMAPFILGDGTPLGHQSE